MSTNFVSLDDKKNTVEIVMGGETFSISRLTIKASKLIQNYLIIASKSVTQARIYESELNSIDLSLPGEEVNKIITDKVTAYEVKAKKFEKELEEAQAACIKKILSDNGYEYNEEFWTDSIEAGDTEQFINLVYMKDKPEKEPQAEPGTK